MKTTDEPIVVIQEFDTSAENLWNAITKPEEMRTWFFENMNDFKPEPGFKTQFPVKSGERTFTHQWTVMEVIPLKRITLNWRYKEYPGDSFINFDLEQENRSVKLRVTTTVAKDFPDEIPEFTTESCLGGWKYFICGRLKDYFNSKLSK